MSSRRARWSSLSTPISPTFAFDVIESTSFCLARLTVGCVNLRVPEPHGHRLERPALASGVHRHGHRRTRSQRCEDEVVRSRVALGPSHRDRLVCRQHMSSGHNRLCEAGCAAVDGDDSCFVASRPMAVLVITHPLFVVGQVSVSARHPKRPRTNSRNHTNHPPAEHVLHPWASEMTPRVTTGDRDRPKWTVANSISI